MKANEIVPEGHYFNDDIGVVSVSCIPHESTLLKCWVQYSVSPFNRRGDCVWLYPASLKEIVKTPKEKLCATVNVETKGLEKAIQQLITELMMARMSIDLNTEAVNRSKGTFALPPGVKSIHLESLTLHSCNDGLAISSTEPFIKTLS